MEYMDQQWEMGDLTLGSRPGTAGFLERVCHNPI